MFWLYHHCSIGLNASSPHDDCSHELQHYVEHQRHTRPLGVCFGLWWEGGRGGKEQGDRAKDVTVWGWNDKKVKQGGWHAHDYHSFRVHHRRYWSYLSGHRPQSWPREHQRDCQILAPCQWRSRFWHWRMRMRRWEKEMQHDGDEGSWITLSRMTKKNVDRGTSKFTYRLALNSDIPCPWKSSHLKLRIIRRPKEATIQGTRNSPFICSRESGENGQLD